MGDLSKNFSSSEFACKCGCGLKYPAPGLIKIMQKIRDGAGAAVNISSGWRCTLHNKKYSKVLGKQGFHKGQRGDDTASSHTRGEAADFSIAGLSKIQAYELIQKLHSEGEIPELKYCYVIKDSAANVHIDVGVKQRKSIWGGVQ